MQTEIKLMILVNSILGLSFVGANLIYDYFGNMPSHHTLWSPIWLTFYNTQALATIGDVGAQVPNFSFYFFWVLLFINIYFLLRLGRKKSYPPKQG